MAINHSLMERKLVDILEAWSRLKDQCQDLPPPTIIVYTWVEFQFILDDPPILFDILTPSQKSKRHSWILLEQEYKAYMNRSSQCSSTSTKMKSKIKCAFMGFINTTPGSHHQKAQVDSQKENIMDRGTYDGIIQCLEETIKMMMAVISRREQAIISWGGHSSSENLINLLLFVAYFLRDLLETKANIESVKTLSHRVLILIYNIFDVLQLKGLEYDSNVAYKLMIKMYDLMRLTLDEKRKLLWKSGRLGHPLCASPLNMTFIRNLSNEPTEVENFQTYINHFGGEFQQHFSFLFSNYHLISSPKIEVSSKDPICSHPTFQARYIYQTLIAKGKLVEALSYAKEAQERQYSELSKFTHGQEQDKRINIWEVIKSIVEDAVSFNSQPIDLDKMNISVWKTLQGYLESTLQVGVLYEMMGDGVEAAANLKLRKEISSSLDLDLFVVSFSSLLGKIYTHQGKIDMAKTELTTARKILIFSEENFGCSKCKLLFNSSVIEHIGHLRKIKPTACEWFSLSDTVKNFYERALEELDDPKWKNSLSCPDNDASLNFPECPCSQMGCWECLPTRVDKSGLLEELMDLKWEFHRRKMSMKLLSQSEKIFDKVEYLRQAYQRSFDKSNVFKTSTSSYAVERLLAKQWWRNSRLWAVISIYVYSLYYKYCFVIHFKGSQHHNTETQF